MTEYQSPDTIHQLPSILEQIPIDSFDIDESDPEQFVRPDISGHNENLADILPSLVLDKIAAELTTAIEED